MTLNAMIGMTIITAVIEVLCFAGNIFGWPFLHFVLEKEDYFLYLCNVNTSNVTAGIEQARILNNSKCVQQVSSFNLVFTLASSFLLAMAFPLGYFFDRFGTLVHRVVIGFMYSLGYVLLAVSTPATSDLLFPAMIFIAFSGLGLLLSNLQLGNLIPSARGAIVTLLNGAFDSSVVVYFLFKQSHDNGSSIYLIFQVMAGATLFIWFRTFVLMPRTAISPIGDSKTVRVGWKEWFCFHKTQNSSKTKANQEIENSYELKANNAVEVIENKINGETQMTFKNCLQKKIFWTNIFQFSVLSLRVNYFLGNLKLWLENIKPENEISSLMDAAGIITMMGAFVAPLNGLIIDLVIKKRKKTIKNITILNLNATFVSMVFTSSFAIVMSVLVVIPTTYPSFIFLLITRSFLYGGFAAFLAMNFPYQHFGKLFGLSNLIAGLINLFQLGIVQISIFVDPTMFYINISFLILSIITLIHPLIIFVDIRKTEIKTIA